MRSRCFRPLEQLSPHGRHLYLQTVKVALRQAKRKTQPGSDGYIRLTAWQHLQSQNWTEGAYWHSFCHLHESPRGISQSRSMAAAWAMHLVVSLCSRLVGVFYVLSEESTCNTRTHDSFLPRLSKLLALYLVSCSNRCLCFPCDMR